MYFLLTAVRLSVKLNSRLLYFQLQPLNSSPCPSVICHFWVRVPTLCHMSFRPPCCLSLFIIHYLGTWFPQHLTTVCAFLSTLIYKLSSVFSVCMLFFSVPGFSTSYCTMLLKNMSVALLEVCAGIHTPWPKNECVSSVKRSSTHLHSVRCTAGY